MNCCHLDSGQTIYTWDLTTRPALTSHWVTARCLDTGAGGGWIGGSDSQESGKW